MFVNIVDSLMFKIENDCHQNKIGDDGWTALTYQEPNFKLIVCERGLYNKGSFNQVQK